MRKGVLLLVLGTFFVASVSAQTPIPGAEHRDRTAQLLQKAKKPKGTVRSFSAVGDFKENLGVLDSTFADETARIDFISSLDYKALAEDGFFTVLTMDLAKDTWLSRVCKDHFAPMEPLIKNGVAVADPGRLLGLSLLVSCEGLQINGILPDSAAAKAGIQNGDYLIALNGQAIHRRPDIEDMLRLNQSANELTLSVRRDDRTLPLKLSLVELSSPSSPWPDAFSRRSYKLGITISQFRSLPFPDWGDRQGWPNAYPVCTDEARSKVHDFFRLDVSVDWKDAGVVECKFFADDGSMGIQEAALKMGSLYSTTTFLFIPEDGKVEPRLFLIKSVSGSDSYQDLKSTFAAAFGKPSKITQEPAQTEAGAVFSNEITTWENPSSTIEIARYGETINLLQVTYSLKPLAEVFDKKLAERRAKKAKTL